MAVPVSCPPAWERGKGELVLVVPNESHLKFVELVNDVGLHVISIESGVLEEDL